MRSADREASLHDAKRADASTARLAARPTREGTCESAIVCRCPCAIVFTNCTCRPSHLRKSAFSCPPALMLSMFASPPGRDAASLPPLRRDLLRDLRAARGERAPREHLEQQEPEHDHRQPGSSGS
jgi:hypothetical protein